MSDQAAPEPSPSATGSAPKSSGGSCLKIFIFGIILMAAALFGGLQGIKYYALNCQGMMVSDCILKASDETETVQKDGTVVKASGPYTYSGHSVAIVMNIPLDGGGVTGTVTGDCTGNVKGTYDGKDNGVISGSLTGYCTIAIVPVPAKAAFQGTVNKTGKTVPVSFDGSGAGFTHSGSLSLSY